MFALKGIHFTFLPFLQMMLSRHLYVTIISVTAFCSIQGSKCNHNSVSNESEFVPWGPGIEQHLLRHQIHEP